MAAGPCDAGNGELHASRTEAPGEATMFETETCGSAPLVHNANWPVTPRSDGSPV